MRGTSMSRFGGSMLAMVLSAGASAMATVATDAMHQAKNHQHTEGARITTGGYDNRAHSWTKTRKRKGWMKPGGSQNAKAARRVRA